MAFLSCSTKGPYDSFHSKIDKYFTQNFPGDQPGAAVLLIKDSTVVFSKGYGLANLKTQESITKETILNIGSITKTFVATAIVILEDEGKLSFEDPVAKYFPDFKNKDIGQKVKIKHLLTHTSGLPDNRQVRRDSVFYLTANDAENWYPETQVDFLEFESGSQYKYSNPAFNGLALIVAQVSGMKWQDFVHDRIFLPAGMKRSTITDGTHPASGVAHGYIRIQGQWREDDFGEEPTFCAAGNGGVWSSVEELWLYELALRKGTLLKHDLALSARKPKEFENWKAAYAPFMGWGWRVSILEDSVAKVGHTGTQGGFESNYVCLPERGIFLVILCNSPSNLEVITDQILNWVREEEYFSQP